MNRLTHRLGRTFTHVGGVVVAGLLVGTLLFPAGVATAAKAVQDVFITNDAAHPVPVTGAITVNGTPQIAVANQPTVAVAGTPNVNVANVPDVNIANREPVQFFGWKSSAGDGLDCVPVDAPAGAPFLLQAVDVHTEFSGGPNAGIVAMELYFGVKAHPDGYLHVIHPVPLTRPALNSQRVLGQDGHTEPGVVVRPNEFADATVGDVIDVQLCWRFDDDNEFGDVGIGVYALLTGTSL